MRGWLGVLIAGCAVSTAGAAGPPGADARLRAWVRQLREGDTLARQDAAEALGRLGAPGEKAIPALAEAMRKDPWVRRPAALALGRLGPKAVPVLVEALRREADPQKVGPAGAALVRMGPKALPALVRALEDDSPRVRAAAIRLLGEMGPEEAPALAGVLRRPDPELDIDYARLAVGGRVEFVFPVFRFEDKAPRRLAVEALARIGPRAVPSVRAVLKDDRKRIHLPALRRLGRSARLIVPDFVRERAREDFGASGVLLALQAPTLLQGACGPDPATRAAAAEALGEMGPDAAAAVPDLIRLLRDRDADVRIAAAEALGKVGPHAKAAVPALAAAIKEPGRRHGESRSDPKTSVRRAAVLALLAIGPHAEDALRKDALPFLIADLESPDLWVRVRTVDALGKLGARAEPAGAALIAALKKTEKWPHLSAWADTLRAVRVPPSALAPLLKDHDVEVRRKASAILLLYGRQARPAARALVAALKDPDLGVRGPAAVALAKQGLHVERALPVLVEMLKDDGADAAGRRRALAARALQALGPKARPALPALPAVLREKETPLGRIAAAAALVRFGAPPEEPLAVLVELLREQDSHVHSTALGTLEGLGPKARPAARDLVKLLKDEDVGVRVRAARALGRVGDREARLALPVLVDVLKTRRGDQGLLDEAITALAEMGPPAAGAVPELAEVLRELPPGRPEGSPGDSPFRINLLWALGRIGPRAKGAVPALREMLRRGEATTWVLTTLGQIGPAAAGAVPEVMAFLHSPDEDERASASTTLGEMGPAARRAVPRLRDALHDEAPAVRAWSAYALVRVTGDPKAYLPLLARLVPDTPDACSGLERLGPPAAKEAVPELVKALRSKSPRVREAAVRLLGRLGPSARPSIPALVRLLDDPEFGVRYETVRALGKIGPPAHPALPRLRALAEAGDDEAEEALLKIRGAEGGRP